MDWAQEEDFSCADNIQFLDPAAGYMGVYSL